MPRNEIIGRTLPNISSSRFRFPFARTYDKIVPNAARNRVSRKNIFATIKRADNCPTCKSIARVNRRKQICRSLAFHQPSLASILFYRDDIAPIRYNEAGNNALCQCGAPSYQIGFWTRSINRYFPPSVTRPSEILSRALEPMILINQLLDNVRSRKRSARRGTRR